MRSSAAAAESNGVEVRARGAKHGRRPSCATPLVVDEDDLDAAQAVAVHERIAERHCERDPYPRSPRAPGSVTVNVDPLPRPSLSAATVPPCASAM